MDEQHEERRKFAKARTQLMKDILEKHEAAAIEAMATDLPSVDPEVGDLIRITCKGVTREGRALSVEHSKCDDTYAIEFVNPKTDEFGYWKQWADGGHVEVLEKGREDA